MTKEEPRQKQAAWKTLLIMGIIAGVAWLVLNDFPEELRNIIGLVAAIGLGGGLIIFITTRRD